MCWQITSVFCISFHKLSAIVLSFTTYAKSVLLFPLDSRLLSEHPVLEMEFTGSLSPLHFLAESTHSSWIISWNLLIWVSIYTQKFNMSQVRFQFMSLGLTSHSLLDIHAYTSLSCSNIAKVIKKNAIPVSPYTPESLPVYSVPRMPWESHVFPFNLFSKPVTVELLHNSAPLSVKQESPLSPGIFF